jgi:pimeloyl-ACP methyl ester carboxylesterase
LIDALERGTGPAIVLLHGVGSRAFSWSAQLEGWSDAHRVIAWDAPGYGRSDALGDPTPSVDMYAEALADLLAALDVERPVLVGHSLGALIAAAFAAAHPDRLRGLVLSSVACGYGSLPAAEREARYQARARDRIGLGAEAFSRKRSSAVLSPHASPAAFEQVRAAMSSIGEAGYLAALRMLFRADIFTALPAITAPTLVLCGAADDVTPPEQNRRVAQALGGARFALVEDAGHAVYVEQPEAFGAIVRAFITERERARESRA